MLRMLLPWFLPDRGSRVLTTCSSSTISSSSSWDVLSDMDSLVSLPRLTIFRKEGLLDPMGSHSVFRSPQGRLSLRSSLRRPVKLHSSNARALRSLQGLGIMNRNNRPAESTALNRLKAAAILGNIHTSTKLWCYREWSPKIKIDPFTETIMCKTCKRKIKDSAD